MYKFNETLKLWKNHLRFLDELYLFPFLYKNCPDKNFFEKVLLFHFSFDPAWYKDFTQDELLELTKKYSKEFYKD